MELEQGGEREECGDGKEKEQGGVQRKKQEKEQDGCREKQCGDGKEKEQDVGWKDHGGRKTEQEEELQE